MFSGGHTQLQQNIYRASTQNSFPLLLSRKFSLYDYIISASERAKLGWKQSEQTEGRIGASYVSANESKELFHLLHSLKKKEEKKKERKKNT